MPVGMVAWKDLGKPELLREVARLAARVNTLERQRSALAARVAELEAAAPTGGGLAIPAPLNPLAPDTDTDPRPRVVRALDWEGGW